MYPSACIHQHRHCEHRYRFVRWCDTWQSAQCLRSVFLLQLIHCLLSNKSSRIILCHFLCLDAKKVTKEKSRKKWYTAHFFLVLWFSFCATVNSKVVMLLIIYLSDTFLRYFYVLAAPFCLHNIFTQGARFNSQNTLSKINLQADGVGCRPANQRKCSHKWQAFSAGEIESV